MLPGLCHVENTGTLAGKIRVGQQPANHFRRVRAHPVPRYHSADCGRKRNPVKMYCPTRQGPVSSHRQAGPGDPEKNENRRRNPTEILTSLKKNPTLKCSADFSAKPLFCLDQTLLIAQVGLVCIGKIASSPSAPRNDPSGHLFIDSKKSLLFSVTFILSIRKSIVSTTLSG